MTRTDGPFILGDRNFEPKPQTNPARENYTIMKMVGDGPWNEGEKPKPLTVEGIDVKLEILAQLREEAESENDVKTVTLFNQREKELLQKRAAMSEGGNE